LWDHRQQPAYFVLGLRGLPPDAAAFWRFSQIVASNQLACGIHQKGTLACWGRNLQGNPSPPRGTFTTVSLGVDHTGACAIKSGGDLTCWGPRAPRAIVNPFAQVSVGTDGDPSHSRHDDACGVRPGGTAVCWGPAVGYGGWITPPSTRTTNAHTITIPGMKFIQIEVSDLSVCGLRLNRKVACWFPSWNEDTGYPSGEFSQISMGDDPSGFFCGLRRSGQAVCWGDNEHQAGDPPQAVFKQIAAGTSAACGILKDNTAVDCWGSIKASIPSR
jgi:hypothetical protein